MKLLMEGGSLEDQDPGWKVDDEDGYASPGVVRGYCRKRVGVNQSQRGSIPRGNNKGDGEE